MEYLDVNEENNTMVCKVHNSVFFNTLMSLNDGY